MGCEADPKPATLVVSDAPRRLVLLPVPGSSRTSPLRKPGYRGQVKRRPVFLQSPAGWQRLLRLAEHLADRADEYFNWLPA
nr:hypothetical protein [Pseudomonas syringae pv. theae]